MGKKKIDELFQEKFINFEQVPDDKVWQAIAASLDKKKKRVIPIWWKLGGVAAVIAIGLFTINPFGNSADGNTSVTTVEQNSVDSVAQKKILIDEVIPTNESNNTQLTESNSKHSTEKISNPVAVKNAPVQQQKATNNNLNVIQKPNGTEGEQLTATQKQPTLKTNRVAEKQNTAVVDNATNKNETIEEKLQQQQEDATAVVMQKDAPAKTNAENLDRQHNDGSNDVQDSSNLKEILPPSSKETGIANTDTEPKNENKVDSVAFKKKSIYDEIIEEGEAALAQKETKNRWSAGPSVAPVYFDAFGEGSPVHSILVPNSKSGNTNLSYGLSVAYAINDRLSVRSGIHKVDYGYETGEIEFSSSLDGSVTNQMANIDYASTARNLVVKSKVGATAVAVNSNNENALDASFNSTARNGSMTQQFGYLEVPVELNYALIDKKIGVHVIGGVSSLFLIDNSISLTDGNQTTEMGEANNVNSLNFSTNIGLGIDYEFTPKVKLNIEPVFKYQLNTFDQVDGTFNPFSIGVYSGLTFTF